MKARLIFLLIDLLLIFSYPLVFVWRKFRHFFTFRG